MPRDHIPDLPDPDDHVRLLRDRMSSLVADAHSLARAHGYNLPACFADGVTMARDALDDWIGTLMVERKAHTKQAKANTVSKIAKKVEPDS